MSQFFLNTMVGYVYRTTNNVNGYVYIGQHKCGYFDTKYRGSGKLLKEAIKEYGWNSFKTELICAASSYQELNDMERLYIHAHKGQPNYNIANGGTGGVVSSKYIYVDLETKLIYMNARIASLAAGVSRNIFMDWVNYKGMSTGMFKYVSSNKHSLLRKKPKHMWITYRWVKLESSALLRMKNPIFAKGL